MGTNNKQIIETIKQNDNLEGFAREDLLRYAEENKLNAGDVFTLILDSLKQNCPFNFFGCSDSEGHHLAFHLEDIEEALNLTRPTCREICEHGCCAYINRFLTSVGKTVNREDNNEA